MNAINVKGVIALGASKGVYKCIKNGYNKINSFVTSNVENHFDIMLNILYYHKFSSPAFFKAYLSYFYNYLYL